MFFSIHPVYLINILLPLSLFSPSCTIKALKIPVLTQLSVPHPPTPNLFLISPFLTFSPSLLASPVSVSWCSCQTCRQVAGWAEPARLRPGTSPPGVHSGGWKCLAWSPSARLQHSHTRTQVQKKSWGMAQELGHISTNDQRHACR